MRRHICLMLCMVSICLNILSLNMYASEQYCTEQSENLLNYMKTDYPRLLQQNSNYKYIQFANDFNSNWECLYFLNMADLFAQIGVEPDENKYKEVLLNIIETHDLSRSTDIAEQKK